MRQRPSFCAPFTRQTHRIPTRPTRIPSPTTPRMQASPPLRRSKLILTRRVHTWNLREDATTPPPQATAPSNTPCTSPTAASTSSVPTYVLHRPSAYPCKRRPGDPPHRYLNLAFCHVPVQQAAPYYCSHPALNGGVRRWHAVVNRWQLAQPPDVHRLSLRPDSLIAPVAVRKRRRLTFPNDSLVGEGAVSPLLRTDGSRRTGPRIIVIGDVHGCITELQALLRLANYSPGDQVLLLGDLVAKGPDSVAVVQLCREIGARSVRGNHDFEVVRWWDARRRGVRGDVSPEHARIADALSPAEHAWLLDAPWFIDAPDINHLFVHAGFIPGVKLTQQNPRLMMNMRSVLPDGTVSAKNVHGCEWARLWKGPSTVVFGHDAFRGLQMHPFAMGIDTGCVYGGRLTALLLPENRLISVAAKRAYISPKRFRGLRDNPAAKWKNKTT